MTSREKGFGEALPGDPSKVSSAASPRVASHLSRVAANVSHTSHAGSRVAASVSHTSHAASGTPHTSRNLGSQYLIVFVKLETLLTDALKDEGGLNFTQFRLLLKAAEEQDRALPLSELADMLHIQPNVVSQSITKLEQLGLVERAISANDGRSRSLIVMKDGQLEIDTLNERLAARLYAAFNPGADPLYDKMLEATILAAAEIQTSLTPAFIARHRASAALMTYSIVLQRIVDAVSDKVGISFNEARILQRLAEVDQPMRAVDLSCQLMLPATTITRAATRLEKRGWVVRLVSSVNQQAIFLGVTEKGRPVQTLAVDTIDSTADEVLWGRLTEGQCDAIERVGEVFLADMRAQDGIRRYAVLGELTPLKR